MVGCDPIEIRIIDAGLVHSIIRAGDSMLLTFSLTDEPELPPPLLELSRLTDGGLCDRLADNFIPVWEDTDDETLTSPQQLDPYLTNNDQDDLEVDDHPPDPAPTSTPGSTDPWDAPTPAGKAVNAEPEHTQRRWPGRPN